MTEDEKYIDEDFAERIARIEETRPAAKHALGRGIGGLVPVRKRSKKREVNIVPLALLLVMGSAFKAFVLANAGYATYQSRIEPLINGNQLERFAGWFLQADVVTLAVADFMPRIGF